MADDRDLLIKDFEHWLASFVQNEDLGDKRLNFFTGIVTAVFGAIGFLAKEGSIPGVDLPPVMAFASLVLLLLGYVTTLRLLRRNQVTDGYLKCADALRKQLAPAWHLQYKELLPKAGRTLRFGGLVHFTAVLNGGLSAVLLWSLSKMLGADPLFSTCAAFLTLVFVVLVQWRSFSSAR